MVKLKLMIILVIFLATSAVMFWVIGFIYANDLSIPTRAIPKDVKTVLVVFPHADDEALSAAGTLSLLTRNKISVHWLILTKGERGNEGANYDEKLKEVRIKEAQKASSIYGVDELIQLDYPDNDLASQSDEMTKDIDKLLTQIKPELVITYDLTGLYGHPDHVVTSEVVTDLVKNKYSSTKLWYVSFPKKLQDVISLPEHMAKDPNYSTKRSYPNLKIWIGLSRVVNKTRAIYTYESQKDSFSKSFPIKFLPTWFYTSLTPFEYFYEVQ